MQYWTKIPSPLGTLTAACDGAAVTGVWFDGQKYFGVGLTPEAARREDLPVFEELRRWLKGYFSGEAPAAPPAVRPAGTPFRQRVWAELLKIPRGTVATYGQIAEALARDGHRTSARAVGGAVGHNPVSILIPCHRVVGSDGGLTGYAGGLERKLALLKLEGFDCENLRLPV